MKDPAKIELFGCEQKVCHACCAADVTCEEVIEKIKKESGNGDWKFVNEDECPMFPGRKHLMFIIKTELHQQHEEEYKMGMQ